MRSLELLAPAKNEEIGIAAIDCGADAVYIGAPAFGARKAAGNSIESIAKLCTHAHRYGARVFVTFNTVLKREEVDEARRMMLDCQDKGADAFIVRDPRIFSFEGISVPLHASTQCAIRTLGRARELENAGCGRIVLERELPLATIREICSGVDCEVECFVHGALCVCYSGVCRLSEVVDGRSADRGECIQACRSLYDLTDADGRTLARNKALLSLKDYNLHDRLEALAEAGVCSFKIEGRLKNISYVKNIVRYYDQALRTLVEKCPDKYCRASFGKIRGGFCPDPDKTFNRGYTQLYLDARRERGWSSMDAPKSMGEEIGKVLKIRRAKGTGGPMEIAVALKDRRTVLNNGDGFAFVSRDGSITGFRGDVCEGAFIRCKYLPQMKEGMTLYRNISAAFEKELETQPCHREIAVEMDVEIKGKFDILMHVRSEDGREFDSSFKADVEAAENKERALAMLREQLSKRSGIFDFRVKDIRCPGGSLPLLSASTINSIRRLTAEDLDRLPCRSLPMHSGKAEGRKAFEDARAKDGELMRTKYCIRYELGLCPRLQGAARGKRLYLTNNGRRLTLGFDCTRCEMTVSQQDTESIATI